MDKYQKVMIPQYHDKMPPMAQLDTAAARVAGKAWNEMVERRNHVKESNK